MQTLDCQLVMLEKKVQFSKDLFGIFGILVHPVLSEHSSVVEILVR